MLISNPIMDIAAEPSLNKAGISKSPKARPITTGKQQSRANAGRPERRRDGQISQADDPRRVRTVAKSIASPKAMDEPAAQDDLEAVDCTLTIRINSCGSQIGSLMARPKRFELLTPRFVVWCSIQLSYGRVFR